jgi:hypothetical protein
LIQNKPKLDEKTSLLSENNNYDNDKDDEIISTSNSNTVNQVQDLLKKIGDNTIKNNLDEEEEEDVDIENYLNDLENKKK